MKILFLGEIVGRPGRRAVIKELPNLKEEHQPDLILANVENLAHGIGITTKTVKEMEEAGIDAFTSGNHIFKKKEGIDMIANPALPLLRPANYPPQVPGEGYRVINVGMHKMLLVNLIGQVFIKEDFDSPFRVWDQIKAEFGEDKPAITIIDFHAEATSEKIAFALHADGDVSAIVGSHTHVPTQDFKIMPGGTGYVTDIGMIGPVDTVIGVDKDVIIKQFIDQIPGSNTIPDHDKCEFNALVIEIDNKSGKTTKIEKIYKTVDI